MGHGKARALLNLPGASGAIGNHLMRCSLADFFEEVLPYLPGHTIVTTLDAKSACYAAASPVDPI